MQNPAILCNPEAQSFQSTAELKLVNNKNIFKKLKSVSHINKWISQTDIL